MGKLFINKQDGFTYVVLLFIIVIAGVMMMGTAKVWSTVKKKDNEKQLLFVGMEYVEAIEKYYTSGHGGAKFYPKKIKDLLKDPRSVSGKKYLRKPYKDPMTGKDFELIKEKGTHRIMGVKSKSTESSLMTTGFPELIDFNEGRGVYNQWEFVYKPKKSNKKKKITIK